MTLLFDNANIIKLFKLKAMQKRQFQGLIATGCFGQVWRYAKNTTACAGILTMGSLV